MVEYRQLTENDQQRVQNRVEQLAIYEEGDIVALEPHDGPRHSASHLEGTPLFVDEITFHGDLRVAKDPSHYHEYDEDRVITVEIPEIWERNDDEIDLYLPSVAYSFKDNRLGGHDQVIQQTLTESSLIPWSEYDGPVSLTAKRDNRREYTDKLKEGVDPCPICESTRRRITGVDDTALGWHGSEYCAVCGYVLSETPP